MYPAIIYCTQISDAPFIQSSSLHSATERANSPSSVRRTGVAEKMRGFVLVSLLLMVKLRCSLSGCEEPESGRLTPLQRLGLSNPKRNLLKRYSDLDYDSFVGLMGRRDAADTNAVEPPQKREMHDIFVGLMGRRNSEPDNGAWRREYPERRGIFVNKCRLRFLQGL
ncbi:tachykinin-3a isoform X2 [Entelurus aequoreus]|uniref:tachykinin-3a isoform X2 n=1 Tax=Entelurus aequoreus TaxID=161455 RepID=UPI002B1DA4EE|nr:tachykinin-3a isoform X2 [Entelurus aequoreus]